MKNKNIVPISKQEMSYFYNWWYGCGEEIQLTQQKPSLIKADPVTIIQKFKVCQGIADIGKTDPHLPLRVRMNSAHVDFYGRVMIELRLRSFEWRRRVNQSENNKITQYSMHLLNQVGQAPEREDKIKACEKLMDFIVANKDHITTSPSVRSFCTAVRRKLEELHSDGVSFDWHYRMLFGTSLPKAKNE